MAAKKVYAVKKGKQTGIFESWEACKAVVDGYPGAEYKGFAQKQEALEYLGLMADATRVTKEDAAGAAEAEAAKEVETVSGQTNAAKVVESVTGQANAVGVSKVKEPPIELPEDEHSLIAYVDGSYEHSLLKYAFGCVFLLPDGRVLTEKGSGNDPENAKLRNVTGEMLGAMFAVKWAMKNGFRKITLRYDYEGVEKWVTGAWKSKTELTQKYAMSMREWSKAIGLSFDKVTAHSNVYYNELADKLAKSALLEEAGVPKMRLAAEMENYHG